MKCLLFSSHIIIDFHVLFQLLVIKETMVGIGSEFEFALILFFIYITI